MAKTITQINTVVDEKLMAEFDKMAEMARRTELELMYEEAHDEGFEMGLAEGREKGLAEGLEMGLAEGREKGLAEGHAEGHAEGMAEAQESADKAMALAIHNLMADGVSVQRIAQAFGKTEEEIGELLKKY